MFGCHSLKQSFKGTNMDVLRATQAILIPCVINSLQLNYVYKLYIYIYIHTNYNIKRLIDN